MYTYKIKAITMSLLNGRDLSSDTKGKAQD